MCVFAIFERKILLFSTKAREPENEVGGHSQSGGGCLGAATTSSAIVTANKLERKQAQVVCANCAIVDETFRILFAKPFNRAEGE